MKRNARINEEFGEVCLDNTNIFALGSDHFLVSFGRHSAKT